MIKLYNKINCGLAPYQLNPLSNSKIISTNCPCADPENFVCGGPTLTTFLAHRNMKCSKWAIEINQRQSSVVRRLAPSTICFKWQYLLYHVVNFNQTLLEWFWVTLYNNSLKKFDKSKTWPPRGVAYHDNNTFKIPLLWNRWSELNMLLQNWTRMTFVIIAKTN